MVLSKYFQVKLKTLYVNSGIREASIAQNHTLPSRNQCRNFIFWIPEIVFDVYARIIGLIHQKVKKVIHYYNEIFTAKQQIPLPLERTPHIYQKIT